MIRVETFLDTWKAVRADTAQAVEDMPAAALDFRPVEALATFREIARHILDATHALTGMLLEGEQDLAAPDFREKLKQHVTGLEEQAPAAALAAELRKALELRSSQLAARGPEFLAGIVRRMDGQQVTRLEMLQFVKEHEIAHRSQLFLYLRLQGVTPPTTRRRQTKK